MELPAEMVSDVNAIVDEVTIDGRTERIAHLGRGFTTMVPDYIDVTGQTPLTGCLVWDRNLWLNFRTEPSGQVLVTERASLLRRAARTPTTYPGVYSVDHQGPSILHRGGTVPAGFGVVARALSALLA
ncbi:hypothetical protein ABEU20_001640 [Rhodococcus sp. PAM 2766]|uniref:Uncharacterized protein n=1 Tax=Rhodococcus parequi TaxID=3137122 RepID=A0ABW9FCU2_9NOCA